MYPVYQKKSIEKKTPNHDWITLLLFIALLLVIGVFILQ